MQKSLQTPQIHQIVIIMELKIELPKDLTTEGFEPSIHKRGKPIDPEKLDHALDFISKYFTKRKTGFNRMQTSFTLTRIICRRMDKYEFVSNGELIAAMLMSGYKCKTATKNSLNCHFNVQLVNESKIKELLNSKY